MKTLRVIQCGLGPIGLMTTREMVRKGGLEIVAAIDVSPALIGRDLGELAGLKEPLGVKVSRDVEAEIDRSRPDVCVLTTASSFKVASGHMRPFISCGIPVVSSCEEASFPYTTDPACAATVDEWAQSTGVAVLGTGINPGFLMDLLPIALSAPMARVDRVRVERIQDAGRRRLPFQQKVGAGLELADFQAKIDDGSLRHVGLTESMHMIGEAFGFDLERTEDRIEPLVAADAVASAEIRVRAGQARGVRQTGRAWRKNDDQAVIEMTFIAGIGESDPVDRVTLDGDPGIVSEIRGGVPGDLGTCSILVNAIPRVVAAQPGLITMLDLPPVFCWRPA